MKIIAFAKHAGGGIRTYLYYVYSQPVMADCDFKIVAPMNENVHRLVHAEQNISVFGESKEHTNRSLLRELIRAVRQEKPDIVQSHGFTAGLLAALPLKLLGIKHVITTHDVFVNNVFEGARGKLKWWLLYAAFSLADRVNPVGHDAGDNLIASFPRLPRSKISVIRNGIPSNHFLGDSARELRKEADIPAGSLVAGFFGRFMSQKGFRTLVEAVKMYNSASGDARLHVCCFGWGGFIREEQQALKEAGLDRFFSFFPATENMAEAIRGVDFVVMPSKWEACPLLAMETLVAGRPLVASNCIGLKEVTEGQPVLKFSVGDSGELLEQVRRFETEAESLQVAVDANRSRAAETFDVSETAEKLRGLFGQL